MKSPDVYSDELTLRQSFVGSPLRSRTALPRGRKTYDMLGDYCDVYLTHDSMSVRKAHNSGRNHLRNVVDYYQRTAPPHPDSKVLQGSPATRLANTPL